MLHEYLDLYTDAAARQKTRFDFDWALADNGDCNSQQHSLARIFCDLHCIRDAVKKGNKLILDSLSDSVSILNLNMQALFNHYLGAQESAESDLAQVLMQGEQMVKAGLTELKAVAKGGMMPPMVSAGLRHVAQSFETSWLQRKREMMVKKETQPHT